MELISTDSKVNNAGQISKLDVVETEKYSQKADSKYQEILYWKGRIVDTVPSNPDNFMPISMQMAIKETLALTIADPSYPPNKPAAVIVFYNQRNFDSIDILRHGTDLWDLSTPVFCEDENCRFRHIAQSDTRRLRDIINMFFNEGDWHGLANFKFDAEIFKLMTSGRFDNL